MRRLTDDGLPPGAGGGGGTTAAPRAAPAAPICWFQTLLWAEHEGKRDETGYSVEGRNVRCNPGYDTSAVSCGSIK